MILPRLHASWGYICDVASRNTAWLRDCEFLLYIVNFRVAHCATRLSMRAVYTNFVRSHCLNGNSIDTQYLKKECKTLEHK